MSVATGPDVRFDTGTELRGLAWARRDRARFVDVPEERYLVMDGTDTPGGDAYLAAIGALYAVAYGLHVGLRRRGVRGHHIGAFGALYWLTPDQLAGASSSPVASGVDWRWRLLIDIPDEAAAADVQAARDAIGPPASQVELVTWREGRCGQILHVGSYGSETPALRRLYEAMAGRGLRPVGPLHEIYLNDPSRVGEENARTVLRQEVEPIR
jgi:hypothetical protein